MKLQKFDISETSEIITSEIIVIFQYELWGKVTEESLYILFSVW